MFRDILVILEGRNELTAGFVVVLAQQFKAHATAFCPDLNLEAETKTPGPALRRAQDFTARARAAEVAATVVGANEADAATPRNVVQFARAFDLVIVEQPMAGEAPRDGGVIGALLSGAGRPVLTAPAIWKESASFENVAIAWDGSAAAARAIGDAMPFLRRAGRVEVVTVADRKAKSLAPTGEDIVQHLLRHEAPAIFRQIPGEDDPANMLLSYVADSGANLLVCGGYGHSRLREAVLGGVTRTLLGEMTLPVLMAH